MLEAEEQFGFAPTQFEGVEAVAKAGVPVNNGLVYLFIKRAMDVVCSLLAAVVLLLPMLLVALVIKIDSPGPAIFRQERLGLNGQPFVMYKFRSMIVNAESRGPVWSDRDDYRCTRVGRVIRKCRIDELPQLINIIKGDMSIVGPRPERTHFYREFDLYIPNFKYRLLVKPGLTGLAQVNGGYDLLPEEKIVYDLEYAAKRSLWLDIKLILATVGVVFSREGAR